MKTPHLLASMLFALGLATLGSGCSTTSYSAVPIRRLQTYAIVAVDDHGILSQAELDKIRDTLVQFLFDQGYVSVDQHLIDDPVSADIVFRIKIAWPATGVSIAILGVAPSYGGDRVYAGISPSYAPSTSWLGDEWSYDPGWYGDWYGYSYGPYCPFLTVFPFIPFYGFDHHHRPSPPFIHRSPPTAHRPQPWNHYSHYVPPRSGGETRPPLLAPHRSHPALLADRTAGPSHFPAATRTRPIPEFRNASSAPLLPRPRIPYSDRRPATDSAMARPQPPSYRDAAAPADATRQSPQTWGSNRRRLPDSASSHPSAPASVDRPRLGREASTRTQRSPDSDYRSTPDAPARHHDSSDRSPGSGAHQREYAAPQRSSPPPQREYSAPHHDYSPPVRESSAPAHESSPAPAHSSSSSSASSNGDSRSRSGDKDR